MWTRRKSQKSLWSNFWGAVSAFNSTPCLWMIRENGRTTRYPNYQPIVGWLLRWGYTIVRLQLVQKAKNITQISLKNHNGVTWLDCLIWKSMKHHPEPQEGVKGPGPSICQEWAGTMPHALWPPSSQDEEILAGITNLAWSGGLCIRGTESYTLCPLCDGGRAAVSGVTMGRSGDNLGIVGSIHSLIPVSLIREWVLSISDLDGLISHDLFPQLPENTAVQSCLQAAGLWRYMFHVWGLLDSATTATLHSSRSCKVQTIWLTWSWVGHCHYRFGIFVDLLKQWSPTFLAPETSFVEDNFSTAGGRWGGLGMI